MAANAIEAADALCVITAADIEFKTIAKLLSGGRSTVEDGLQILRSQHGAREVTLLKSEIGAVGFAEKLRAHLVHHPYKALVVIGLAGALDPALRTGDVVLYDRCLDGRDLPQPTFLHNRKCSEAFCNAELTQRLLESFNQQELPCQCHSGLSVERVVIKAQQKRALYEQTQAGAVDMETYLILAAVADFKRPCAAIRVVMDEAASDLPDFNAGLDMAGRVQLWPTVLALAASPRTTLTFMLTLRPALRNLERVARAVFKALNSR
jgi:nucleoside phosphorylase